MIAEYRVSWHRQVAERSDTNDGHCVFVMLNPSTADERFDDPTTRRCRFFAAREGCHTLEIVNLFSARTPHPAQLKQFTDPVGRDNEQAIDAAFARADLIVAAWGSSLGAWRPRRQAVERMMARLERTHRRVIALKVASNGSPWHPLYVRSDEPSVPFARLPDRTDDRRQLLASLRTPIETSPAGDL